MKKSNKKKNKKNQEDTKKILMVILLLLILLIAGTYAMFTQTLKGKKINILRASTLSLIMNEETTDGILLEKAIPISDRKGFNQIPYTFSLQNNEELRSATQCPWCSGRRFPRYHHFRKQPQCTLCRQDCPCQRHEGHRPHRQNGRCTGAARGHLHPRP